MATLKITKLTTNPVRLTLTLNGQGYTLEYPDKATAINQIKAALPDPETMVEIALLFVLKEWVKTDPNLTNAANLVNKTCTINVPTVNIT
jgi:hypothetical protein